MTPLAIAAGVDARDDRTLGDIERYAEFKDRVDERACDIADDIVRDPERLHGFFTRGDLMLHEITGIDAKGVKRTGEELVAMAIAMAIAKPLPVGHPLNELASIVVRSLQNSSDVRERALSDVRAADAAMREPDHE